MMKQDVMNQTSIKCADEEKKDNNESENHDMKRLNLKFLIYSSVVVVVVVLVLVVFSLFYIDSSRFNERQDLLLRISNANNSST